MCFARGRDYPAPPLAAEELARIIREAAAMRVFEIRVTGGEAYCVPEFFSLVELMDELGINVSINTHGAYSPAILQRMIESPVDDIRISIDGPELIHDGLRGKDTFARAVRATRELVAAGKRVRLNTMVFKGNQDVLDEMVDLANSLNVRVRFCPMRAIGMASRPEFAAKHVLSREAWHRIEQDLAARGLFKLNVSCFSIDDLEDFSACPGPEIGLEEVLCGPWHTQMGIDAEGQAYAGGRIDDIAKSLSVGSMRDYPLRVLWQRALRDVFDRLLPQFPNCTNCRPRTIWDIWNAQLSQAPSSSRHLY